jgi:hypothetical protein
MHDRNALTEQRKSHSRIFSDRRSIRHVVKHIGCVAIRRSAMLTGLECVT